MLAAALMVGMALAGCALGQPTAAPVKKQPRATTATATVAPQPAQPARIHVTATVPLVAHPAAVPAYVGPPAGIQDVVFANASEGWLVTSEQVGYGGPAWTSGIWRTTDGGQTWDQVWSGWKVRLDAVGILPQGAGLYAAGLRVGTPGSQGSPLWLTSDDGGVAWNTTTPAVPPFPSSPPGFPTWSSLHFDFATPDVGFGVIEPEVAPYGPSTVVLATRDGGRTWIGLPLPTGFRASGGLDFVTPDHGWITGVAPGSCDQIWKTRDGGRTWAPVPDTCPPYGLYAVDFVSAERGFASGGTIPFVGAQTGILETTDGGAHWHSAYYAKGTASVGPLTHLSFTSATDGWVWGGTCKMGQNGPCPGPVMVTRDAGATWTKTSVSALALSIAGGIAWAQGGYQTGLWRSADGGAAWSHLAMPAAEDFGVVSTSPGGGDVWLATTGGTFRSTDDGTSWTPAGPSGTPVLHAGPNLLFSSASPELQVSRDGGKSWSQISLPGETNGVSTVAFATPQEGWALLPVRGCGFGCTVVDRTEDGGLTWATVGRAGLEGTGEFAAFSTSVGVIVSVAARDPNLPEAAIGISHDGGAQWQLLWVSAGSTCYRPAAVAATVLVPCQAADGAGYLLRSTDGGRTWRQFTAAEMVPEDVAMSDPSHGWMLAGAFGPSSQSLYRTDDGGATWSQVWPALPPVRSSQ